MTEYLILVDQNDIEKGKMEKLLVHQLGLLHRAFSVFVFNTKGELLLQQRADEKYHSAGLWSNTCCSHPQYGESTHTAVQRRLKEEVGLDCETQFVFNFIYKANFENGLCEHEYDHVYFGVSDDKPILEESEVQNWRYIDLQSLQADLALNPDHYSEWVKICLPEVKKHFKNLDFLD